MSLPKKTWKQTCFQRYSFSVWEHFLISIDYIYSNISYILNDLFQTLWNGQNRVLGYLLCECMPACVCMRVRMWDRWKFSPIKRLLDIDHYTRIDIINYLKTTKEYDFSSCGFGLSKCLIWQISTVTEYIHSNSIVGFLCQFVVVINDKKAKIRELQEEGEILCCLTVQHWLSSLK